MNYYGTVALILTIVSCGILGSDDSAVCDERSKCIGNRPKAADGCCPLMGGELCEDRAVDLCDS